MNNRDDLWVVELLLPRRRHFEFVFWLSAGCFALCLITRAGMDGWMAGWLDLRSYGRDRRMIHWPYRHFQSFRAVTYFIKYILSVSAQQQQQDNSNMAEMTGNQSKSSPPFFSVIAFHLFPSAGWPSLFASRSQCCWCYCCQSLPELRSVSSTNRNDTTDRRHSSLGILLEIRPRYSTIKLWHLHHQKKLSVLRLDERI